MPAFKTHLVAIGNSRGIRLPKPIIEQAGLGEEVEIVPQQGGLLIRSAARRRDGWEAQFRAMADLGDDRLLDEAVPTVWDETEWTW